MPRTALVCFLFSLLLTACAVESADLPGSADPHVVTRIDDYEYRVTPAWVDDVAADPSVLGARLVPTVRDGVQIGYKTYAIAPDSVLAQAGFEAGDTVIAVNDVALVNADAAALAIAEVRANDYATVELIRRGEVLAVHVWVE